MAYICTITAATKRADNNIGDVTFNLDSNTYIVKMHKTGYYFANQTLVVPATTLYKISDIA